MRSRVYVIIDNMPRSNVPHAITDLTYTSAICANCQEERQPGSYRADQESCKAYEIKAHRHSLSFCPQVLSRQPYCSGIRTVKQQHCRHVH